MLRVVDVRGIRGTEDRAKIVYVGRAFAGWPASPFANPFKPGANLLISCLERYRMHLFKMPGLEIKLAELWEQTKHGKLPLGCWCCDTIVQGWEPVRCHAQVLAIVMKQFLEKRGITNEDQ